VGGREAGRRERSVLGWGMKKVSILGQWEEKTFFLGIRESILSSLGVGVCSVKNHLRAWHQSNELQERVVESCLTLLGTLSNRISFQKYIPFSADPITAPESASLVLQIT